MKARLGEPDGRADWRFEVKWDGYRAIAFCDGSLRLQGRRLNEITGDFPELTALGSDKGSRGHIFDGELVVFGEGATPDFQLMQARRELGLQAQFLIFDLLWAGTDDLRSRPYDQRRQQLEALDPVGAHWSVPERLDGELDDVLAATARAGLEGVVAKDPESPYIPGQKSRYWIKVKHLRRQEFVVGGWLPGKGHRTGTLGALLLGYQEPARGELRFAGRVGTGLSDRLLRDLADELRRIERPDPPFPAADLAAIPREANWVEPQIVVEVRFTQWTREGYLRNPVFVGFRPDKAPREVVREGS